MTIRIKIIGAFFLGLSFVSCHIIYAEGDNYLKNISISNEQGLPKYSTTFYYPSTIRKDTNIVKTGIDSFILNWYSSALYAAKEPILYNYYLGHDIYRFLWLRSFHRPVVFSFNRDGNKIWLTTKELNKQPDFFDQYAPIKFVAPELLPISKYDTTQIRDKEKEDRKIIKKADRKAEIILNQTINLTEQEWDEFETILNNCSFWTSKPYIETLGLDGSEWIIEGHLRSKYWFINRWSPHDNFRKAGEYLIKKSKFKEVIY